MRDDDTIITPELLPEGVKAFFTTRNGGVSDPPFASMNVSMTVGDDEDAVRENRLRVDWKLPSRVKWLRQAHTSRVLRAGEVVADADVADGVCASENGSVCAVMTADCAPVLLCTADGLTIAAVHAGWRGLAAGVIANAITAMRADSQSPITAWIGPAISAQHYPVGAEVRAACLQNEEDEQHFQPIKDGENKNKFYADITGLARRRLLSSGVVEVSMSGECTCSQPRKFFSARRDGEKTGRMAAVIWRE